jgi:hypothetical protein
MQSAINAGEIAADAVIAMMRKMRGNYGGWKSLPFQRKGAAIFLFLMTLNVSIHS